MPNKKKQAKRILSVTIKHMLDDSPDTSWLGEYSDTRTSPYSIDRAHDEDCPWHSDHAQAQIAVDTLEHAQEHINSIREDSELDSAEDQILSEAISILSDTAAREFECACIGDDWNRREYRYFNGPVDNYAGIDAEEVRKYVKQDYDRMESLNAGNWYFLGIKAQAEITVSTSDHTLCQKIHSGGLWGLESDMSKCDFEEVETEQLAELREQLTALGFSRRAIATAFKTVEHKDA